MSSGPNAPIEGLGLENESAASRLAEAQLAANRPLQPAHPAAGPWPALAMSGAIVLWGGSFIATKAAILDIPPVGFALLRFVLATAVMGLALWVTRTPVAIPRDLWARTLWASFLGITMSYVLENVALKFTTAGNAGLFIAASPLATIVGAVLFLGDRPGWRQGLGALMATVAIIHMVGASLALTGLGDGLMGLTMVVSVIYALISKELADRLPIGVTLAVTFALGTLGLLPFAWGEAALTGQAWHVTPVVLGAVAYLGLGSSCLACWLWMYALRHMAVSTTGVFMYGMPVVTLACSHWLLGEPVGWTKALEAAVILGGVYLASTRSGPQGKAIGNAG